jgi:hypothetical protein
MSSSEYAVRLFYRQPWGDRTVPQLLAKLLEFTYAVHRNKDSRPMTADDFLPSRKLREPEQAASLADVRAFLQGLE